MSSPLDSAIANLAATQQRDREEAARHIYNQGSALAESAVRLWRVDNELNSLLRGRVVGLAVSPSQFDAIRKANDSPRLAEVPPDQDAKEFELQFAEGIALDVLTSKDPTGSGAIARYLAKFGPGIQQVELSCAHVRRACEILQQKFGLTPIYPVPRLGANATLVNFFLVSVPEGGKLLIELFEAPGQSSLIVASIPGP